jgi:hypothetical protein
MLGIRGLIAEASGTFSLSKRRNRRRNRRRSLLEEHLKIRLRDK